MATERATTQDLTDIPVPPAHKIESNHRTSQILHLNDGFGGPDMSEHAAASCPIRVQHLRQREGETDGARPCLGAAGGA